MMRKDLEHGLFQYSPIVDRPPIRWKDDAFVAVWVIPNIEHFRFSTSFPGSPDPGASPDIPGYSLRDYGNRVGVWRIMEALEQHGVRATAALNSDVCDYEPEIIRAGMDLDWEWMGHGTSNSVRVPPMTDDEQAEMVESCLARIARSTGTRPKGWLSPGLGQTLSTPGILARAGITYVADWINDDQPYCQDTEHGQLVSLPYSFEVNDKRVFEARGAAGPALRDTVVAAFDTLYAEGPSRRSVLAIAVHPYLTGASHNIRYLREALAYVGRHQRVWWATGAEIVERYAQGSSSQNPTPRDSSLA